MTLLQSLMRKVKEFCLITSLQGYKYIYLDGRPLLERCFWLITMITSIIATAVVVIVSKNEIEEEPTILVTDSINHPLWNYNFPAVTICPLNKISRMAALEQAERVPKKLNHTTKEISELFIQLSRIHFYDGNLTQTEYEKMLKLENILESNDLNIVKLLRDLATPCDKIAERCKWKGEEKNCGTFFDTILTSEGVCCSFNFFGFKVDETLDNNRKSVLKEPRRISASGNKASLEVIVNTSPEDYAIGEGLYYGNKIIIHNSVDFPDWTQQTFLLGMRTLAHIEGNPSITLASEDLRSVNIYKRFCYFDNEFPLTLFRNYSYQNCLTECRKNLTLSYCGCIPVMFANELDNSLNRRLCSIRDIICLSEHKAITSCSLPGWTYEEMERSFGLYKLDSCSCLPDCSYTEYDFRFSESSLNVNYSSFRNEWSTNITLKNHSLFRVFFKNLVGTKNRRSLQMNWQTYFAFYGGVLGFLIGLNFISGIEFVYFFTVKLAVDFWKLKFRKTQKPKPKQKPDSLEMKQLEIGKTRALPKSWYLP